MRVTDKQGRRGMRAGSLGMAAMVLAAWVANGAPSFATSPGGSAATLDGLVQQFRGSALQPEAEVNIEAWVEADPAGPKVVVMIEPEGRTKLIADPGITITPSERDGLRWRIAVPYRHVDTTIDYFAGPAAVHLPFSIDDHQPIELRVEYAYCVVDYQCFFGEETLSIATRLP